MTSLHSSRGGKYCCVGKYNPMYWVKQWFSTKTRCWSASMHIRRLCHGNGTGNGTPTADGEAAVGQFHGTVDDGADAVLGEDTALQRRGQGTGMGVEMEGPGGTPPFSKPGNA